MGGGGVVGGQGKMLNLGKKNYLTLCLCALEQKHTIICVRLCYSHMRVTQSQSCRVAQTHCCCRDERHSPSRRVSFWSSPPSPPSWAQSALEPLKRERERERGGREERKRGQRGGERERVRERGGGEREK